MNAEIVTVNPVISSTIVEECVTTAGSTTVTGMAIFGSVVAGQAVYGAGIPFGTTVVEVVDSSEIVLSNPATADSADVDLQFGYFTSLAYAVGDQLGFPFRIPKAVQTGIKKSILQSIHVSDAIQNDAAFDILIFNLPPAPTSADNAALALGANDLDNLVAVVQIGQAEYSDFGSASSAQTKSVGVAIEAAFNPNKLPKPQVEQDLFGLLVARSAATWDAIDDLRLKFGFLVA